MTDPVISFDHVYKKFAMGEQHTTLRDLVAAGFGKLLGRGPKADPAQLKNQEFWAVKDLSFHLKKGESLGIIGPNGSGKSTTLKLLSGILRPDRGTYNVKGRLSALIEVGAGFHPDLTGRENVFLNGSILGMTRKEVQSKFADIVDFAGVGDFIDTPVKRYSSGMAVRLGFAVAAFIEPDVLLVDEVLAVGDTEFRNRCHNRMTQMLNKGVTLILVSHNLEEVRNLCDDTILLFKGEKLMEGPTPKVIGEYHQRVVGLLEAEQAREDARHAAGRPAMPVEITRVEFLDKDGVPAEVFYSGDPMTIRIHYRAARRVDSPHVVIDIDWAADDQLATTCDTRNDGARLAPITPGPGHIDCKLGPVFMVPSLYGAAIRVFDGRTNTLQGESRRNRFVLNEKVVVGGFYGMPHEWEQSPPNESLPEQEDENEMETAV
jgi:ABC-type polysaccharide/polyol phosphate transport system ATPase subunit